MITHHERIRRYLRTLNPEEVTIFQTAQQLAPGPIVNLVDAVSEVTGATKELVRSVLKHSIANLSDNQI